MTGKCLLSLAFSLLVLDAAPAANETKAVAFIRQLEGTAGKMSAEGPMHPTRIVSVGLGHRKITDAGLKELAPLAELRDLHLHNTSVGDAGLKELAPFKQLMFLGLDGTRVTDAGLKDVTKAEHLLLLSLADTAITDAGLKDVAKIKKLHRLILTNTAVTDSGLKELSGLTNLEVLDLAGTKVTAAGLKALAPVKTIRKLILNPAQVDDDVLGVLRANTQLQYVRELTGAQKPSLETKALRLGGYRITDAGIPELAEFKGVKYVDVSGTKVTAAGVAQLKTMWPGVRVETEE